MLQENETSKVLESETLIAQATPSQGSWQQPYSSPENIIGIHMALLRTGKVLMMGGSSLDRCNRNCRNCSAVWDVSNGTFKQLDVPNENDDADSPVIDLFCSGHSFRPNGSLLVGGGTETYDPYRGTRAALLFNPVSEQWERIAAMAEGRWYPTLVTLGSGRVIAFSGLDAQAQGNANTPEVYPYSNIWRAFSQPTPRSLPLYPHLTLMANGKLFYSGAAFYDGDPAPPSVQASILTLPSQFTQAITEQLVNGDNNQESRNQAATILLPPAQDQKVMIIGGGANTNFGVQTTKSVKIIDLKVNNPSYNNVNPVPPELNYGRMHHNAIILPDRTVFVCNGSTVAEDNNSAIPPAEIYNPQTNTWTPVATQTVPRVYHGTAILLPDGRVASAGSANFIDCGSIQFHERRIEFYSPGYISLTRPAIQNAPQSIRYNNTFTVQTPQAQNIKWVSLIRPMATTHSLDTDQRLVNLPITSRTSTSVTVSVTNNRNIAPPGWYMLFINDNTANSVPSVARWIQLT